MMCTAWKVSKYGAISGQYFPAFGLNTERYEVFSPNAVKYGLEITPCSDTFHAVVVYSKTYFKYLYGLLQLHYFHLAVFFNPPAIQWKWVPYNLPETSENKKKKKNHCQLIWINFDETLMFDKVWKVLTLIC